MAAVVLLAAALVGAATQTGCGGGAPIPDATATTGGAPGDASSPLSRLEAGGVVAGVVFERPLPLADVLALGPTLGGDPIALYRTDYACVRPITGGAPEWAPEPSRFAYVDAGGIRERRLAAVNAGLSPPITGQRIAESYWLHWEDQWARAQEPGVLFEAAAVYLPEASVDALRGDPLFRDVVIVPHRRTDSLSPDFPGELLLESEEFVPGYLTDPPMPDCGA